MLLSTVLFTIVNIRYLLCSLKRGIIVHMENHSSQTRINAAISYFFLGFLFLLARNHPQFSLPFVRAHAKRATKLHGALIGYLIIHIMSLSRMLGEPLPIILLSPAKILIIFVFTFEFFFLIR